MVQLRKHDAELTTYCPLYAIFFSRARGNSDYGLSCTQFVGFIYRVTVFLHSFHCIVILWIIQQFIFQFCYELETVCAFYFHPRVNKMPRVDKMKFLNFRVRIKQPKREGLPFVFLMMLQNNVMKRLLGCHFLNVKIKVGILVYYSFFLTYSHFL